MTAFDIVEDTSKTATAGPIAPVGADFAPGVAEQLAKMGQADMPAISVAAAHDIRFLGSRERSRRIELEWPLSFDGREFHHVMVRRMSLAEVDTYMEETREIAKTNPDRVVRLPLFVDEHGAPLPEGLWEALDVDDVSKLSEAGSDFLPRRFLPTPEASDDTASPGPAGTFETASAAPTDGAAAR